MNPPRNHPKHLPTVFRRVISYAAIGAAIAIAACSPAGRTDSIKEAAKPNVLTTAYSLKADAPNRTVRVGVLAFDKAALVHLRYRPLLDHLAEATGRSFTLVPLTQSSQFSKVASQDLHFVITNPLASVQLRRLYGTAFIATQVRPKTGASFAGLIVVKRNSPIKALKDLRGKRVACVNFQTAAGGCVFQIHHLQQQGIDPYRDFSRFIEIRSQDSIVLGVLNDSLDAGFIRTGQLEQMVTNDLINSASDLRILEPKQDNFHYRHTTDLYPEWAVAVLRQTDSTLTATVENSLLSLPPDYPALVSAGLAGFEPAQDYASVEALVEQLRLKGWDTD
ncbi:MAG: phosphate/phosphite/phosphonate ABC transporter substrate-binding protein [Elainellaceae cyanobacterium]